MYVCVPAHTYVHRCIPCFSILSISLLDNSTILPLIGRGSKRIALSFGKQNWKAVFSEAVKRVRILMTNSLKVCNLKPNCPLCTWAKSGRCSPGAFSQTGTFSLQRIIIGTEAFLSQTLGKLFLLLCLPPGASALLVENCKVGLIILASSFLFRPAPFLVEVTP